MKRIGRMALGAWLAFLIMVPLGSARAQTIYDIPEKNIFDTVDTLCDGSDPSIVFCDGFEDGVWFDVNSSSATATSDYWNPGDLEGCQGGGNCIDPKGRNWTECGGTPGFGNAAKFGAAGTNCTATQGSHNDQPGGRVHGTHWISAQPGDPDRGGPGLQNVYARYYLKFTGLRSDRCTAGFPNCSAAGLIPGGNGNAFKGIEQKNDRGSGGIEYWITSSCFETTNHFGLATNSCFDITPDPGGFACHQSIPNIGGPLEYLDHFDEWIFIEIHVDHSGPPGTHVIEQWSDFCGEDGLQCTGTPTLRTRNTGLTMTPKSGCVNDTSAIWVNFWSGGYNGEVQIDEMVYRDGSVLNAPIGFLQPDGSSSPAPSPSVPPPAPVLLPETS